MAINDELERADGSYDWAGFALAFAEAFAIALLVFGRLCLLQTQKRGDMNRLGSTGGGRACLSHLWIGLRSLACGLEPVCSQSGLPISAHRPERRLS